MIDERALAGTFRKELSWARLDEAAFRRLLSNHGRWCEQHSQPGSPSASLWTLLEVHRQQFGKVIIRGVSTAGDSAEPLMEGHLAALADGVDLSGGRERTRMPWLDFALNPLPDLFAAPPDGVSLKLKDALLKKAFTDRQIAVAYDYLTRTDHDVMGGMLGFATYGGQINAVARDATASVQRGAILDMACTAGYQDHYPRLQAIKARWDPRNVFTHALSISAP